MIADVWLDEYFNLLVPRGRWITLRNAQCPGVLLLDSTPSFIVFLPFPVSPDASWDPFTDTLLALKCLRQDPIWRTQCETAGAGSGPGKQTL